MAIMYDPDPVKLTDKVAVPPKQILLVELVNIAVGLDFTVITAFVL